MVALGKFYHHVALGGRPHEAKKKIVSGKEPPLTVRLPACLTHFLRMQLFSQISAVNLVDSVC